VTFRDLWASRHAIDPPHLAVRRLLAAAGVVVLATAVITGMAFAERRLPTGTGTMRAATAGAAPSGTGAGAASSDATADDAMASTPGRSSGGTAPATSATTDPEPSGTAISPAAADLAGLTTADRTAGVLRSAVPQRGTGKLVVVAGASPAPGSGTVKRVRVDVEGGLPVDGAAFATFVMDTLNDPRSWGHGGRMTFARTAGAYDVRVVLASPDTSARLCAPLQTMGTLSCGQGSTAVLTLYRWVKAIPDYGTDRTGYRRYVINHEVGHTLGHGHEYCPGPGKVAPLMMQQTKGLKGCLPNSWPYP
jgi:hypothetical protein